MDGHNWIPTCRDCNTPTILFALTQARCITCNRVWDGTETADAACSQEETGDGLLLDTNPKRLVRSVLVERGLRVAANGRLGRAKR